MKDKKKISIPNSIRHKEHKPYKQPRKNQFFETILQSMGEGILVLDRDFKIKLANRFFLKMLKRKEKEVLGKHCYQLIQKRKDRCIECAVAETFKTGKPASICNKGVAKYGSFKTAKLSSYPIFFEKGRVTQVIEKIVDISDCKQAGEQSKTILNTAMDGFWRIDREGNILEVNDAYCTMTGYCREELLSMGIADIEALASLKDIDQRIQRITKKEHERFETQHRCKDGKIIDIESSANYLQVGEGRFFAFMRDITERKRAEKEKEKMQIQMLHSQKMEIFGQLAGGIAHEFNNILMALLGYAENIKRQTGKGNPVRKMIIRMLSLINRATDFTRSLLIFSRKNIINPKTILLNKIIKDSKKLLSNMLGEDIELTTNLSSINLMIKADVSQIEQVLMNLTTNAKDAMPGGGRIIIKTGLKEINDGKCFSFPFLTFADTGRGMDKKTLNKVFEPFFTTKEVGKGTGLGLSTVYGIIEQHNGFIHVHSKVGKGTTFEIYFPLAQANNLEITDNNANSLDYAVSSSNIVESQ